MISNLTRKELFISLLLHTAFILFLVYQYVNKTPQIVITNKVKIEPINSYLYTLPKPVQLNQTQSSLNPTTPVKSKPITEKATSIKRATITKINQQEITDLPNLKINSVKNTFSNKQLVDKNTITKQNLNTQIKNIHKYLPKQDKTTNQSSQIKSIFNPNPALVPKSTTISLEQREQKRKQQITNYGKDIAIKKDDEGNCTMRQDLTSVGMEGIIATQHFKCGGKTKFEKNFSQHMKAVMDRYK